MSVDFNNNPGSSIFDAYSNNQSLCGTVAGLLLDQQHFPIRNLSPVGESSIVTVSLSLTQHSSTINPITW